MVKLFKGDCLQLMSDMADQSIDCIVTDPPFNMGYTWKGWNNTFEKLENDNIQDNTHSEWFEKIVIELHRVLKQDSSFYCFIDWRNYPRFYNIIRKYFVIKNCIIWDKKSIGLGYYFRYQHEMIIYATKGNPKLLTKDVSDIWNCPRNSVQDYESPTEKPVKLLKKAILNSTKKGDIIFDPFMGGGNTGVAALELERDFIGAEILDSYYIIAKRKITNFKKQAKLF